MIDLVVIYGVALLSAVLLGAISWSSYQNARARAKTRAEKQQQARALALLLEDYSEKFLANQDPQNLSRGAGPVLERARELQYRSLPEFGDEMVAALTTYERISDAYWRRKLLLGETLPSHPDHYALCLDHELAVAALLARCKGLAGDLPPPPRAPAPAPRGAQPATVSASTSDPHRKEQASCAAPVAA